MASGVASARKSSTPASAAMAAAVSRLSPVIITVLMPMRRSSAKRSLMPPLTMSLSSTTPSTRVPSATTSGVLPRRATSSTARLQRRREAAAQRFDMAADRIGRALAQLPLPAVAALQVGTAHARLRREGHEARAERGHVALAQLELLLGQHHDAAAFRRLVGQRGQLRGVGQLGLLHARRRE